MSELSDARKKLRDAGVDEAMISMMLVDESTAAAINNYTPEQLKGIAGAAPSESTNQWIQAREAYGFTAWPEPLSPLLTRAAGVGTPDLFDKGYIVSDEGAIQFKNGVIANPDTGELFYPPGESVKGSSTWLREIQDKWSQDKINNARAMLIDNGYGEQFSIGPKGGFDQNLLMALSEFHKARYLNFGKPVPLTTMGEERARLGEIISKPEIRNEVRAWFREGFGDDPSDAELEWAVKGMQRIFRKQQKKGVEPERAAGIAGARMQEKFFENPQVKYLRDSDEENTEARDSLIQIGQAMDSL